MLSVADIFYCGLSEYTGAYAAVPCVESGGSYHWYIAVGCFDIFSVYSYNVNRYIIFLRRDTNDGLKNVAFVPDSLYDERIKRSVQVRQGGILYGEYKKC